MPYPEPQPKMKLPDLTESVRRELIDQSIDTGIDYAELALDAFLDGGLLRDIPLVGTVYSAAKLASGVATAHMAHILLVFLAECRKGIATEADRAKFRERLDSDAGKKLVEQSIIYLGRYDGVWNGKMLARLLRLLAVNGASWREYYSLASIIDALTVSDLLCLRNIRVGDNQRALWFPTSYTIWICRPTCSLVQSNAWLALDWWRRSQQHGIL